ncbi:MAG: hypothetical protein LBV08_09240 [Clostridiales bacterium]|jgi:hypothetical protein|nr:hypothetical protein [Clostridiales bacterium]
MKKNFIEDMPVDDLKKIMAKLKLKKSSHDNRAIFYLILGSIILSLAVAFLVIKLVGKKEDEDLFEDYDEDDYDYDDYDEDDVFADEKDFE